MSYIYKVGHPESPATRFRALLCRSIHYSTLGHAIALFVEAPFLTPLSRIDEFENVGAGVIKSLGAETDKFYGRTALMDAAERGHIAVVKALLAKNTDVNAIAQNGAIALSLATANGRTEIAQLLKSSGAKERGLLNGSGKTANPSQQSGGSAPPL